MRSDDTPGEPVADASSLEASPDSTLVGDDAEATDSSFEASSSPDAATNDAGDSGGPSDASEATDASDASDAHDESDAPADSSTIDAAGHVPCTNDCALGDQQCDLLPQVCTYDDAGLTVGCAPGLEGIWTCVVADTGCTVWANGVACRSDVPCCVTCQDGLCPLGALGEPCDQDTDCASGACDAIAHVCVSDRCADHRQDGQESDVDCGGLLCDACLGGQQCRSSFDCEAGHYCTTSHVCAGPDASASDAAEEPAPCSDECTLGDQECSQLPQACTYDDAGFTVSCEAPGEGTWTCVAGNAGCAVWAPGVACTSACCAGCEQVACDAGASSLCWSCPPGADGEPCEQDTDCASAACDAVSHQCVANECADHRQDGLETDVDCGGPDCNLCGVGQRCNSNQDCQPGHICMDNGFWDACR